ncbi:hypothetical protein LWI29_033024 [Acer saccharum]|uniref:DUF4283 domain-containing protein n=1 Tax=Acer saccharum TaxID=4024 RepID=A0AA39T746_ACESA|nr:hypothetical protein LWI29_033024 [Acer saccharum]
MPELLISECSLSNPLWLKKSAVGMLKSFANVSKVKRRLLNRGFSFSAKYLGGRAILWSFESTQDCEGFIKNSFFWRDLFISMEKWSAVRSFDEKPTWFNFAGVALDFWNKDFFKKLGSMFGDTVLIDDETLFRKRLNSARLLLLVPPNQTFPKVIKIVDGYRNFYVSVES